jgi:hypothetical protein
MSERMREKGCYCILNNDINFQCDQETYLSGNCCLIGQTIQAVVYSTYATSMVLGCVHWELRWRLDCRWKIEILHARDARSIRMI